MNGDLEQRQKCHQESQTHLTTCQTSSELTNYKPKHAIPINQLFKCFRGNWGDKWCSHLIDPEIKLVTAKMWSRGLYDLTDEQIMYALNHISTHSEFAPTLAQFRKAAFGIIPAKQAYSRWRGGDRGGLIEQAGNCFTSWDLSHMTASEIEDKYIASYNCLVDDVLTVGYDLDESDTE